MACRAEMRAPELFAASTTITPSELETTSLSDYRVIFLCNVDEVSTDRVRTIEQWVRDGGAFTAVRGFAGVPQRGIRFTTTFVRTYDGEFEKLDRLRQLVEHGAVTLRVAATYPPERAGDAHRRLEAGGTRGRLVIEF